MTTSADTSSHTAAILSFIESIGLKVVERELDEACFLPGLKLGPNCIFMDPTRLLYPGDLLHEAGHLAVVDAETRSKVDSPELEGIFPTDGDEIAAVLWSYAACMHLNLPLEVVFHPQGYKNESEWLIESFSSGNYIGLPYLQWMGLCYDEQQASAKGEVAFPAMIKWLRD